ncbi:MAG: aldehyde dehydrogenase family protein [Rhodospirillales bacterium]|nr:aldehyde dehydrogenase family protein [Rhodospirillales bacterium]
MRIGERGLGDAENRGEARNHARGEGLDGDLRALAGLKLGDQPLLLRQRRSVEEPVLHRLDGTAEPFGLRLFAQHVLQRQPVGVRTPERGRIAQGEVGRRLPVGHRAVEHEGGVAGGIAGQPGERADLEHVVDAGIPQGVINLVYGVPAEISEYLIPHPVIRKISFTGSTAIGKQLAALAGAHMKRVTMELGGHAPAIVFDDADVNVASKLLAANKFRNAGQVCISPTRFLVQEKVYGQFVEQFVEHAKKVKVGDGLEQGTTMGPLANPRRVTAMEGFITDAVKHGGKVQTGGNRIGNKGNFFEPTVLTDVPREARVMSEEPFGPLAVIAPFSSFDDVVAEANRLPFGLAAYAYTRSAKTANAVAAAVESGMMSINHHGLALPEVPFGGVKDSGYGSEGGLEAIEAYLNTKFVSQAGL